MTNKRITLFMGHYGSGKTFVAVNYAIELVKRQKTCIYDLDIVNPYFRTVDASKLLCEKGVELVVSPYAETNVDIPAMNSKSYQMIADKSKLAVVDIGGDDRGALALGRFSEKILEENDYEALLVVNRFRPETRDIQGVSEIKSEIESVSKIPFTGIVNNSNLGAETTEKDILTGLEFAKTVGDKFGLPVKFTSVREDLITDKLKGEIDDILCVKPIEYKIW